LVFCIVHFLTGSYNNNKKCGSDEFYLSPKL
jgi:hypothetical protein